MHLVLVATILLQSGLAAAQSTDGNPSRLRRPGERLAATQTDGATDVDARIDTATRRALGERAEVNGLTNSQGGNLVPNRRLNGRVLGRQSGRLSTRIEGGQIGSPDATDGSRGDAVTRRR